MASDQMVKPILAEATPEKKSVAHLLMQLNQLSSEKTRKHMDTDTNCVELVFMEVEPAMLNKQEPIQPIQKRKREPSLMELIAHAENPRTSTVKILNPDTLSKRQRMHGWWPLV